MYLIKLGDGMAEEPLPGHETDYGFVWGPAEVTRHCQFNGTVSIGVNSEVHKVTIYVSPKGHSVRVWRNGKELK
jgi:hypothetical protein